MKMIFKNPRIFQRMHDGPLGACIESYAAEMRGEGYAQRKHELQIRLVTDFSRWLDKLRIQVREVTAALFQPYPSRASTAAGRALASVAASGSGPFSA